MLQFLSVGKFSNLTVYHPLRSPTKIPMITQATPVALPGVGIVYFQTMMPVAYVATVATTMMTLPVTAPARRPGVEVKSLGLFRFLPGLSASLRAKRDVVVCALTSSSCIPRSLRRTRRALEKRRFLRSRRQRLRYVLTWKTAFLLFNTGIWFFKAKVNYETSDQSRKKKKKMYAVNQRELEAIT